MNRIDVIKNIVNCSRQATKPPELKAQVMRAFVTMGAGAPEFIDEVVKTDEVVNAVDEVEENFAAAVADGEITDEELLEVQKFYESDLYKKWFASRARGVRVADEAWTTLFTGLTLRYAITFCVNYAQAIMSVMHAAMPDMPTDVALEAVEILIKKFPVLPVGEEKERLDVALAHTMAHDAKFREGAKTLRELFTGGEGEEDDGKAEEPDARDYNVHTSVVGGKFSDHFAHAPNCGTAAGPGDGSSGGRRWPVK